MARSLKVASFVVAVTLTGVAGCGNISPTGGIANAPDGTFKITGPSTLTLKPGERQPTKVMLVRESGFSLDVVVSAETQKGLKIEFPQTAPVTKDNAATEAKDFITGNHTVKPTDPAEVPMMISANTDAPPDKFLVKVTATPKGGTAVTINVEVTVTKP